MHRVICYAPIVKAIYDRIETGKETPVNFSVGEIVDMAKALSGRDHRPGRQQDTGIDGQVNVTTNAKSINDGESAELGKSADLGQNWSIH